MGVFFIGDTHLGHTNAIKWRTNFSTPEEHDETIFNNIMNVSGKRNQLYVLGDFCIHKNAFHYVEEIAKSFDKVKLVLGNHDLEREYNPTLNDYINLGIEVYGFVKYKEFWLSHCPIHPNELRGKVNIHGHVHDKTIIDCNYFNASCENVDFKPISLENIRLQIKSNNV